MARYLFGIFLLITPNPENRFTFGYSAGSLIWSGSQKNFIPIESVPTFQAERQNYLRKSRELEIHDFQHEILKVTYYEVSDEIKSSLRGGSKVFVDLKKAFIESQEENIIHFYDNDTRISGVCGELWNMLSEYLNFTMVTVRAKDSHFGTELPNGSYNGLLGMLTRDDVQVILRTGYYVTESKVMAYTMPVWSNRYRLYIRPETETDSTWMFNMFSRKVWCSILLLFLFMSVLGYTMQRASIRVSRDKSVHHNLHDYLFHTFATLCCQGSIPDSLYRRTKILGLSKKIFAWLLLITVSSHLISYMSNQKVQSPFEDLDTMFNSSAYNIVVFNGSIVYDKFKKISEVWERSNRYKDRFYYVKTPQRLYAKGCWGKKKYAILDSEDRQRAYGRFKCNLVATGRAYFSTWMAGGVSKTFKYKRTLDIGILKLNEFGLTDGLKDRWMAINLVNKDPNVVNAVNFDQVSMLFTILCMGVITSVAIFVLENIVFLYHHNQRKILHKKYFHSRGKRKH